MDIEVRPYRDDDAEGAVRIWNQVVEAGTAFPQDEPLGLEEGDAFFRSQTRTGVAVDRESGRVVGLYIVHPNNVGRCGHICNASYAVDESVRGQHIGEKLVLAALADAKAAGFRIMQFNAVVASNVHARHLYERLGFSEIGTVPGGFRMPDGSYADIVLYYRAL